MKFYIFLNTLGIIFISFMPFSNVCGQSILRGEVFEAGSNDPLIGASLMIKGTTSGTVTDFDGAFELKTEAILPLTLIVSYTGFETKEVEITSLEVPLKIELAEGVFTTDIVEVKGQRISEKQKASPLTVESLDILAIKQTPSDNFYDGLGSLKGVDLTAASLGFKIINTRGFNSTSPVRSLQIIDGVDNQAPGLNFSLGNFLGSSELDVLKVDIVLGASSAFYGPNAFNGVISMTTKNPFLQKGLSVMTKAGERNLAETAFRWADALQNKNGDEFFAYKLNFSYLRADDWEADNYDPVFDTDSGLGNPGRYDAVNIYGDEYYSGNDFSSFPIFTYPGLDIFHRTGYRERDLVDYDTRNLKANVALHFRTQPEKREESPEFIVSGSYGAGTTVYQGENRFSLKGIDFFQGRLEYKKDNKYFLRAYVTTENAGDSYDPFLTAIRLQEASKTDLRWSQDYLEYWLAEAAPSIQNAEGFPPREVIGFDPVTGSVLTNFDADLARQWLADNRELVTRFHNEAEAFANQASLTGTRSFLAPGTPEFEEEFNRLTSLKRTEGGTLFTDRSSLYHVHGEYKITPTFVDQITIGGNARLYDPESEGTIFYDTANVDITNFEFGFYGGIEKNFNNNKWKTQITMRLDKNENYNWLFSPAASVVWKPSANNYLRLSFSSAIRNPTLTDQFLSLDVGRAILSGNLNGVTDLVSLESFRNWINNSLNPEFLEFFDIDPIRPEQVKTFELGYRTTLFNSVYADVGYYFSIYDDFIGVQFGGDLDIDPNTGLLNDAVFYRYAANSTNTVNTQGFSIGLNYYFKKYFMLRGNYSWNKLVKTFDDDPIIPAFNTPEHKFNIGLSGRDVPILIGNKRLDGFGFNINYKWIEGVLFEGSAQFTGLVPSYDLLDAQINYKFDQLNTTLKVGASNLLDNQQFQAYGGPRIGRLAYVSLLYEFIKR